VFKKNFFSCFWYFFSSVSLVIESGESSLSKKKQVSHFFCLDRQPENAHNAIHGLVLPSDRAAAVGGVVPKARAGRVQAGAIFLHYHTGH
jgi:hypothetical protein